MKLYASKKIMCEFTRDYFLARENRLKRKIIVLCIMKFAVLFATVLLLCGIVPQITDIGYTKLVRILNPIIYLTYSTLVFTFIRQTRVKLGEVNKRISDIKNAEVIQNGE